MSDENWRTRETAQAALIELGDAAVPALSATTQQAADEETRTRAATALAQIEQTRAIGASRITLHLHDVPVQQAFAALSRQAHAPIEPVTKIMWQDVSKATISVDLDNEPFWSAMEPLSQQSNLWLQQWSSGLRLNAGGPLNPGPRCVCGPLLLVAQSLSRSQHIAFGDDVTRNESFAFNASVMAEPKLRIVHADFRLHVTEAVDDHDNSLLLADPESAGDGNNDENNVWNVSADLQFPRSNPGSRIKRLAGTIALRAATQLQRLDLKLADSQPTIVRSDGESIRLLECQTLPDGRFETTLAIHLPQAVERLPDWCEQLGRGSVLRLFDADGHPFTRDSSEFSQSAQECGLKLYFRAVSPESGAAPGKADHLAGDLVIESKEMVLPFNFIDLPMP